MSAPAEIGGLEVLMREAADEVELATAPATDDEVTGDDIPVVELRTADEVRLARLAALAAEAAERLEAIDRDKAAASDWLCCAMLDADIAAESSEALATEETDALELAAKLSELRTARELDAAAIEAMAVTLAREAID